MTASLDSLNDRQRAVLQLLLAQAKSYEDLAGLLHTDATGVRSRARAAIDALGPQGSDVSADRREEIADYLLGQGDASRRAATREYLDGSAPGRAWARATATALTPLAKHGLPDIPPEPAAAAESQVSPAAAAGGAPQPGAQRSSELGGRLLAAGVGLVIAIVIIVVVAVSGNDSKPPGPPTTTTPPATTTTAGVAPNQVISRGTLRPAQSDGSSAAGVVAIVFFPDTEQYKLALEVRNLPPSSTRGSAYGVWLYTSPKLFQFVGFPDTVVGPDGKLEAVADLSPSTRNYREVLVTRESGEAPRRPGTKVLRGRLVTAVEAARQQAQRQARTQTQTTPAP